MGVSIYNEMSKRPTLIGTEEFPQYNTYRKSSTVMLSYHEDLVYILFMIAIW